MEILDRIEGKRDEWEEVLNELRSCCWDKDFNELNPLEVRLKRIREIQNLLIEEEEIESIWDLSSESEEEGYVS